MNNLVKLTYDFFGHVIPGMIVFFSLSLLYAPIAPDELFTWLGTNAKIEAGDGSVIIIISYIIGFAMNPIGFFVGRLAKNAYKEYKEKKEKERIEAEKAAANAYDYAGRSNQYGTHYSTISKNKAASNREGQRGGRGGFSSSERGQAMHGARGGFVPTGLSRGSYFNGGIVSLRRR